MQALESARREWRERSARGLPGCLLDPLQRAHQEAVKRRRLQHAQRLASRPQPASARPAHERSCVRERRDEHVPIARHAEHRAEPLQAPLERLCARPKLLEGGERPAQAAQRDAQLMQVLRIGRRQHAMGIRAR